jgi:hypothetical protein
MGQEDQTDERQKSTRVRKQVGVWPESDLYGATL